VRLQRTDWARIGGVGCWEADLGPDPRFATDLCCVGSSRDHHWRQFKEAADTSYGGGDVEAV
jgi:hypothetical protein